MLPLLIQLPWPSSEKDEWPGMESGRKQANPRHLHNICTHNQTKKRYRASQAAAAAREEIMMMMLKYEFCEWKECGLTKNEKQGRL